MPALCFAGFLRLHTSDDIILAGILQSQPTVHQGRNYHFVIVICRKSNTCPGQLRRPHQKLMGRLIPDPDAKGGLRKHDMHTGLNRHEGQIICHIFPVPILAASNQILEHPVAGKAFR